MRSKTALSNDAITIQALQVAIEMPGDESIASPISNIDEKLLQASWETLLTDMTFHLVMSALAVHLDSERIPYVFWDSCANALYGCPLWGIRCDVRIQKYPSISFY